MFRRGHVGEIHDPDEHVQVVLVADDGQQQRSRSATSGAARIREQVVTMDTSPGAVRPSPQPVGRKNRTRMKMTKEMEADVAVTNWAATDSTHPQDRPAQDAARNTDAQDHGDEGTPRPDGGADQIKGIIRQPTIPARIRPNVTLRSA
jgi:hypothetical protein